MQKPFLSVVVATYNRRELLRTALEALARQSYPATDFEVLVISDGSSDGTDEMVREYAARAPYRLRLLSQANAGPSRARNWGMREAEGEVIVFMDDDLEPWPGFLEGHAQHHVGDGDVAVIGRSVRDPARRRFEPPWIAWDHAMLDKQYLGWEEGNRPTAGPTNFYTGNASVRRVHALAVNGFDEEMKRQEDVDLAQRMARDAGVRFVFEANAVGFHRPNRSFASWLSIPFAYGRLDVVRASKGDLSWDRVRHGYGARNRVTRLLARLVLGRPMFGAPIRNLLLATAWIAYRLGSAPLSVSALSSIYNIRYLEGAQAELGGWSAMNRLLEHHLPSAVRELA